MARTRPTAAKKETAAENGKAKSEDAVATKAAADAARQDRINLEVEQTKTLLKRFGEHPALGGGRTGDESLSTVASDLSITAGKAAFLLMKDAVAKGKVPEIDGKDDEALLKAINVARLKVDSYSSWGWLAARSHKSEGFIKNGLEGMGMFSPKAENIASKRAELNPKKPAAKKETTSKAGGRKRPTAKKGNA